VNERTKNHDSLYFIRDGRDGKIKDQCYEAVMRLRESIWCHKWGNQANIIIKCNRPPSYTHKIIRHPSLSSYYKGECK